MKGKEANERKIWLMYLGSQNKELVGINTIMPMPKRITNLTPLNLDMLRTKTLLISFPIVEKNQVAY
jgi:hypothetical protein